MPTSIDNILICGDSFSADWSVKHPVSGWPNKLATEYNVTNLSQAGCSEYKIYKQLQSVDLSKFDRIIVSHTSPYRIPVDLHPIHKNDKLHANCDLIYEDIKAHNLTSLIEYFEKYFNFEYAEFTHNLICKEIDKMTLFYNVIHLSHINWDNLYKFKDMIQFEIYQSHHGNINHYNDYGNELVLSSIIDRLN